MKVLRSRAEKILVKAFKYDSENFCESYFKTVFNMDKKIKELER